MRFQAIELCQLSQTSKSINRATNEESLWGDLIGKGIELSGMRVSSRLTKSPDFSTHSCFADFAAPTSSGSKYTNRSQYRESKKRVPVSAGPESGPPESARSTYRRLHLQRGAERHAQHQLETRCIYELERQRLALLQLRADSYPHFEPDLVLPPLRLGMPDSHAPSPFRLPPFGDTHDTWF